MADNEKGYVNYFEVLGLDSSAKPGEVWKIYKKKMKDLVYEIQNAEITEERRSHYLLEMAKLNAALYILHDKDTREAYWRDREETMALEEKWRQKANSSEADTLRRQFDAKVRHFLSHYVEEAMLSAGRHKECVEASGWDAAHERHASRMLRHYRHSLYQDILERLPYHEVTPPKVDWDERRRSVAALLAGENE